MAKKKTKKIRYSTAPTYQLIDSISKATTTSTTRKGKTTWRKGNG